MKTKLIVSAAIILGIAGGFASCNKETGSLDPKNVYLDLPATPYQYNSSNTNEIVTLGRVLFYDSHLSVNSSISCATCHRQAIAFSDDVPFSHGFQNRLTVRNALPIQNLESGSMIFSPIGLGGVHLFWDGRETSLNSMVTKPILNHVEMGMGDEDDIVEKVKGIPYYKDLFSAAYGNAAIDIRNVSSALAAFIGSIRSSNTLFDRYNSGRATMKGKEEMGRNLFFTKYDCNSCHQTQQPNGYQIGGGFVNIGLDEDYEDNGLGALTNLPEDNGKFKIPNLRNVALTAPYMHDGRFATLEDVLDHYSSGIADHPNLDIRLSGENGLPKEMNISGQEKSALIAFLNTLTDYSMIADPKYSNPFKSN